jgi:predicted RNA-binding protein with PUA-like domain
VIGKKKEKGTTSMNDWLIKSEGDCYSIDDLKRDKKADWTGIRNYQSRNFMTRDMEVGDQVLFYHSGGSTSAPTGVYGIAKVSSKAHPDPTQFDKRSEYFDPKATREKPIWYCVDIAYVSKLKEPITLSELKIDPALDGMLVRARGSRLSIQPVSKKHFDYIVKL